jgi:hypothetical protein
MITQVSTDRQIGQRCGMSADLLQLQIFVAIGAAGGLASFLLALNMTITRTIIM